MSSPMVANPELASAMGRLTRKKSAAMLPGYCLIMNWRNCGVSTVFVDDLIAEDESPKNEPKKNVLFLTMGPPMVPPNSFRREAGRAIWEMVRACRRLLVWYAETLPWKELVPD